MNIGDKIKEIRKSKKLTQKQLAELVDLSEISIRRYEKGINRPTFEILDKIAKALETPLSDILIVESDPNLINVNQSIDELKEQFINTNKERDSYLRNLQDPQLAFLVLCEDCGFKIGVETDDEMSFFGDHVISYTDNDGNPKSFSLTQKQYNYLFNEVRKSIQKEILNSQFYDFLGIGDDD